MYDNIARLKWFLSCAWCIRIEWCCWLLEMSSTLHCKFVFLLGNYYSRFPWYNQYGWKWLILMVLIM